MSEPMFIKLGTYVYIIAPRPILTMYFINSSHRSVCLYLYPPIVARQQIGKNVTAAMNEHPINLVSEESFFVCLS
jgi:hypothetical protein